MKASRTIHLLLLILTLWFTPARAQIGAEGRWQVIDDRVRSEGFAYIYSLASLNDGSNTVLAYHTRYSTKEAYVRLSTDAGESWRTIRTDLPIMEPGEPSTFPPRMHSIQIPSHDLILLAGDSGTIWRTDDQGESWQTIRLGRPASRIPVLQMVDESFGFAMQFDTLWRTNDGGVTWSAEWIDTAKFDGYYPVGAKAFSRDRWIWWAVLPGSAVPLAVLTTTDGGVSWRIDVDLDGGIAYRAWSFVDSLHFYYTGTPDSIEWNRPNPDVIRRTTDGGRSWETIFSEYVGLEHGPVDIAFRDTLQGFVTRFRGVERTADGGRTWSDATTGLYLQTFEGDEQLQGLIWIDDRTVIAYSSGGRILRWVEPSSVEDDGRATPALQVRREADGTLVLENLPDSPIERVDLFNILGRIATLSGDPSTGRFDCAGYPPGIYFVLVRTPQRSYQVPAMFR